MIATVDLDKAIVWMPETELEEVLQNVRMIVGVHRSEIPMDRSFGIDPDIVDAPIQAIRTVLAAELSEAIEKYEPRARLKSVNIEVDDIEGTLNPIITISIGE